MDQVMYWVGVGYAVLSATTLFLSTLARIFPKVDFFAVAAGAIGMLAADFHRLLPGGDKDKDE
jgi:hypothetical protein